MSGCCRMGAPGEHLSKVCGNLLIRCSCMFLMALVCMCSTLPRPAIAAPCGPAARSLSLCIAAASAPSVMFAARLTA